MNDDWIGGYTGGPTPGGSGMADHTAGASARTLYEQTRKAMEDAHAPRNLDATGSTASGAPTSWGSGGYAGGYRDAQRFPLSVNGLLVLLALGAVLWLNTSVLLAGVLIVAALGGALIATLVVWPTVRLFSSGARCSIGQMLKASLVAVCAYGAALYALLHYGGPLLGPLDRHLQLWASASPLAAALHLQPGVLSILILTQLSGVLVFGAVLRWRLRGAFAGVGGYVRACAVGVATLFILGGGAAMLAREALEHAGLTRGAAPASVHLR